MKNILSVKTHNNIVDGKSVNVLCLLRVTVAGLFVL